MKILEFIAENVKLKPGDVPNMPTISANGVLSGAINVIYFFVGAFAVIMIILGGYRFTTSGSKPEQVAKARNTILYSVIGLIVVMFAFVITQFVIGSF